MYADDLILISTTKEGLQKSLNSIHNFCNTWKLEINYKKNKCMTFTKGSQKEKHSFSINSQPIENVNEFKYLGITINKKNCSFSPTPSDLGCKAQRALYSLKETIPNKLLNVEFLLRNFDS